MALVLASVASIAGCGAGRPTLAEGEGPYAGAIRSTNVPRGRDRYHVVCGPCHDHDQLAPPLFDLGWSAEEVRHQIREGNALMPPIRPARLTDADIEPLLAYLVTIGTVREEFAAAPAAPTPTPSEATEAAAPVDASEGDDGVLDPVVDPGAVDPGAVDPGADAGVDPLDADAGMDPDADVDIDAGVDPGADAGVDARAELTSASAP